MQRGNGRQNRRHCVPWAGLLFVGLVFLRGPSAWGAVQLLQNDSFQSGDQAAFQQGFQSGEMAAVTLGPLGSAFRVLDIQLLFGGDTSQKTMTLHLYQDSGGADPGSELFSGDYQLTGSNENLVQLDLSNENLVVEAGMMFRVAVEFHHSGLPSVARDADGIQTGRNWIDAQGIGWVDSATFGLQGDWIIRAEVDTITTQPDAGPSPDASQVDGGLTDAAQGQDGAAVGPDGTSPRDASAAAACSSSDQCSGGQVCYGGLCLSVCSSDGDCSAGNRCHHGLCKLTCTASSQCGGGQICADDVCQAACITNQDCRGGEVCRESVCRTTCSTGADCLSNESCQGNVCLPGAAEVGADEGCGCAAAGAGGTGVLLVMVLFFLGLLVRTGRSRAD